MLYLDSLPTCVTGPDQVPATADGVAGRAAGGAARFSAAGGEACAAPGGAAGPGGGGNGCACGNCCAPAARIGAPAAASKTVAQFRKNLCTVQIPSMDRLEPTSAFRLSRNLQAVNSAGLPALGRSKP